MVLFIAKFAKFTEEHLCQSLLNSFLSCNRFEHFFLTQPAITCSKLTIETLEEVVKYVQR